VQLLGVDLGTTTFKAVVYSEDGAVKATAAAPPPTESGVVVGTAIDLWPADAVWGCLCRIVREAVSQLEDPRVDGLAIAELGLIGLPVGVGGEALYPMVAWMNPPDPFAGISPERIDEVAMFASTGNRLNPIYPPLWISWLRHNDGTYPDTFWKWLNIGEYLSHRMTGEVAIDYSMASQTLVLDQQRLEYRVDLLEEMGLPTDLFPAARNAGEVLGHVRGDVAGELGIAAGTPVMVGGADFVTGSYASGMVDRGDSAIITGTWECTVMCSDRPETSWAIAEVGGICDRHIAPGRWSVRIETFSGDVIEWWRRVGYGEAVAWDEVVDEASRALPGSGGVVFIPHLAGSYGPVLDEKARGAFIGVTNRTTRAELTRAVFEGLCFQSRYAIEALYDGLKTSASRLVTMGGASRNRLWMQTRADVLGTEVDVVSQPDVTPRGAAMIAGVGVGLFADFWDGARAWALDRTTVAADDERAGLYDELYKSVYRPLSEQLTPFHHLLAELSEPGRDRGLSSTAGEQR
jgi:xylulokinase